MTAFLIDEMFPIATAELLRTNHEHDAWHVAEVGLNATEDARVADASRAEAQALVTENVADFAGERDLVLIFVLKRNLPVGGRQSDVLANLLDQWAQANRDPYLGPHWPRAGEA